MLETFIIIWVACGIITAMIAGVRGLSCNGFWIGLLLGPLGILWAFAAPADEAEIEQKQIELGAMKKCPDCAELVKAEAIKCRYCGADLSEVEPVHVEEDKKEN